MFSVKNSVETLWDNKVDGYIIFLSENLSKQRDKEQLDYINENYYPNIHAVLKKHLFTGKQGQSFVLTSPIDKTLKQFVFIGIGALKDQSHVELELLRRAMATGIHIMKKHEILTIATNLPTEKTFDISLAELTQQATIASFMAFYEFNTFKSDKKKLLKHVLTIICPPQQLKSCQQAVKTGTIIGQAINTARGYADTPPNIMTPTEFSTKAKELAHEMKLKCTILDEKKAKELSMGGFLAVGSGSDQESKFIILEYKAKTTKAPTIALIGKGVCFDSGGINTKPANAMEGMKYDMSGATAVLATMNIIAQLKPDVNVVGLMPMVENMPDGKAFRMDDIITCMNGKTVLIKHTDAEGRLILADTLCYAEKFYKPDVMIDLATLTGACLYALGHFYSGLMTKDDKLAEQLHTLGKQTGDRVWRLPLDDDFKAAIKTDIADLSNSGASNYLGGTITAGCFLQNFVEKTPWAHLDIAGTAHDVPGINYVGKGATGAGVRLITEFVLQYKKK